MPRGQGQKLKIVYLMQILTEQTDENHGLTMTELRLKLEQYGISAERKSIYDDLEALRLYGLDIIGIKKNQRYEYYVAGRQFELAELKLLVDTVQSSKFITAKKSRELIQKLESLCSRHEAVKLQRQVYVAQRVKTMNESIYYNVDAIHDAMNEDMQISFQYFMWNAEKKQELRRNGDRYRVSPWALSWNDENYYLVAFDEKNGIVKHFRVDKMLHIEKEEKRRVGKEHFGQADMSVYAGKQFGMFAGEIMDVTLLCESGLAGVFIDRFGKDVRMRSTDEEHFLVTVNVAVSLPFLGWVIGLGDKVVVEQPKSVVDMLAGELKKLEKRYEVQ